MTTPARTPVAVQEAFHRFIDYAGLFPPAALSMSSALSEYESAREGSQSWMLGRFIVPASRLGELQALDAERVERSVIVDAKPDAREWFGSAQGVFERLGSAEGVGCLEVPLPKLARRRETYDATIGQVAMLAQKVGLRDRPIFVEVPRDARFVELLPGTMAALARYGLGAKLRCGGVSAEAFPSVEEVSAFIRVASNERVRFKATAGLHHPVRHLNEPTGFTMHGFLNLLAAAVFAPRVDDETLRAIVADERKESFGVADSLRWETLHAGDKEIATAREHGFVAYGSCSFTEPVDDLLALSIGV